MRKVVSLIIYFLPIMLLAQNFSEKTLTFSVDLTRPVESNTLPKIQWVMPSMENTGSEENWIILQALIESNHLIKDVQISIKNGEQVNSQTIDVGPNEYTKNLSTKVSLFEGNNEIKLTVVNDKGGKVSTSRLVKVENGILSKMVYANRKDYALIFAIDKYDYWTPLSSPIAGAEALQKVLKSDYGFETELVKNPTLKDINKKIAEYEAKSYTNQDQLLVYFAGHGFFDKIMGYGYVVATNSVKSENKNSYLALTSLRATLNNYKCNHIFLVEDICIGDLANTKFTNSDSPETLTDQIIAGKLSVKARKFLNNGYREYADNQSGGLSAFTARLIEALRSNSGGSKPKTFSEINTNFKNLEVLSGGFGSDESKSDFLFIPK